MQPMVLAFNPLDSVSEFFKNLMNNFCKAMYDGLYSVADAQFKGMFESLIFEQFHIQKRVLYFTKNGETMICEI